MKNNQNKKKSKFVTDTDYYLMFGYNPTPTSKGLVIQFQHRTSSRVNGIISINPEG